MVNNSIKKYTGRIYIIKSQSTEKVYIGSTTQPLSKRIASHRSSFNYMIGSGDMTKWCSSYYILNNLDAYIEIISEHENISKDELKKLERIAIENEPNCINKRIPSRPKKEFDRLYEKTDAGKKRMARFKENNPNYFKRWRELNKNKQK